MIRRLLGKFYGALIRFYDKVTSKQCVVSVGDIILKRAELDHCQFLLTTRKLDVAAYVSGRDKTFHYQNTVSRSAFGAAHKEKRGNMHFTNLIESYQTMGYDPNSLLTVDKECRLIDGNHRMGISLFMGIEKLNVRFLKRSSGFPRNLDNYFKLGISSSFMGEVYEEFFRIQNWLIESGNTFCCLLQGEYANGNNSLLKDLELEVDVLNTQSFNLPDCSNLLVLVQFSLAFPAYYVKNGNLISGRATEIERLLNHRKEMFGLDVIIKVSKNCLEGKEMWKESISLQTSYS